MKSRGAQLAGDSKKMQTQLFMGPLWLMRLSDDVEGSY
jgi:hypothetical protein